MARLYKSYCYFSLGDVVNSIRSEVFVSGLGYIDSANSIAGGKIQIDYKDINDNIHTQIITPPVCQKLGFNNSYTGISTQDALEIGTLVVIAFSVAYGIKILRRAL